MDLHRSKPVRDPEDNDSDYGSEISTEDEIIIQKLIDIRARTNQSPESVHARNEQSETQPDSDVLHYIDEEVIPIYDTLRDDPIEIDDGTYVRRCQSRTPLQRFRISRKKNLTVSDLVTSAWCEMKFWYSLTRYGMVKKTPAMKQGTRIHRKLEEQVHVSVPVKVKIAEDTLGLQILNVIQGLRTLQKHGQTRELHVWGMVDGNLVGGKIDELSYSGPIIISSNKNEESDISKMQCAEKDTIDVLSTTDNTENTIASSLEKKFDPQSVYLSDVKTRSVRRLPSDTEFRPTKYQLMLYHRFISILATDKFDLSILTSHFNLDPHKIFSDEFLAQVNSLEEEENTRFIDGNDLNYQQTQSMILKHNNISALWSLMISEFQSAFPNGVESLGNTLIVEFRLAKNGKIIGTKTFPMDDLDLTAYLKHAMEWWNGERPPQGVTIEEAYKCRTCEFADACNWRLQKAEESRIQFRRKRSHTDDLKNPTLGGTEKL